MWKATLALIAGWLSVGIAAIGWLLISAMRS
jgi:hypothetical protein